MNRNDWENERIKVLKAEKKFLSRRREEKDMLFARQLDGIIPDGIQSTLKSAFCKAFEVVFAHGAPLVEKTYSKKRYDEAYRVNRYAVEIKEKKALKSLHQKAEQGARLNMMISGVEGVGLGALGIGIPDIPIFVAMMMKSVYEIALSYGFSYDSEEERVFILKIICAAVSRGERLREENTYLGRLIGGMEVEDISVEEQIPLTAGVLSDRLLYLKFVQGIPLVGVIGGLSDISTIQKVTSYAKIIYKKRYLRKLMEEGSIK